MKVVKFIWIYIRVNALIIGFVYVVMSLLNWSFDWTDEFFERITFHQMFVLTILNMLIQVFIIEAIWRSLNKGLKAKR